MKSFIATIAFLTSVQSAYATNRGFMPGDAFFHSVLTQRRCTELADSDSPRLPFVRPQGEQGALCGYAGYWSFQLATDSGPLIRNLSLVYSVLRRYSPRELREHTDSDGNTSQVETNGFHIFVYNHDFDPLKYNIALRYNENWVEDESSFGPRPSITRLESFVNDRVAFSNDWRDASRVAPLQTKCPAIPDQQERMERGMGSKRVDDPVIATGDIQVIVTASDNLRRYIRQPYSKRFNGAVFYSVTKTAVKRYAVKDGRWVATDWSPELETRGAEF